MAKIWRSPVLRWRAAWRTKASWSIASASAPPNGSSIRVVNERGLPELLRDRDGGVVQSRLDETTLTEIAQATHGTYQPLGPLGEGLNHVRHLVESSTNAAAAAKARKLGVDPFYVPLSAVVGLIVLESLIGTRRKLRENAG